MVALIHTIIEDSVLGKGVDFKVPNSEVTVFRPVEKLQNINPKTLTSALPAWRVAIFFFSGRLARSDGAPPAGYVALASRQRHRRSSASMARRSHGRRGQQLAGSAASGQPAACMTPMHRRPGSSGGKRGRKRCKTWVGGLRLRHMDTSCWLVPPLSEPITRCQGRAAARVSCGRLRPSVGPPPVASGSRLTWQLH